MADAWLLPRAGRKEQIGEAISEAKTDFKNEENSIFFKIAFIGIISCFGRSVFLVMEVISEEEPNNPVKSGRRGSFKFKFKLA